MANDETATLEPEGSSVRRSLLRRLGRALWNLMAVFGILALVATSGGLVYGVTHFSGMSASQLGSLKPMDVPGMGQKAPAVGAKLSLPPYYIGAALRPLPPLGNYSLPLATLSLRDPFETVLAHTGHIPDAAVPAAADWLETSPLGYACDGAADTFVYAAPGNEAELTTSLHCERRLKPYEARIAGSSTGHLLIFLYSYRGQQVLLQMTLAGDQATAEAHAKKLLKDFTWS